MAIKAKQSLQSFPWPTLDPFLFCVHHLDHYPRGNDAMGPEASLAGRNMGMDFEGIDGWRMYHGDVVPGFPRHPHRGFETITIARQGYIDHSDSLGAAARFGQGDVQWMTAGKGIVHAEMFPLLNRQKENPAELFQIWLNLPARSKFAEPYFSMYWNENIKTFKADGVEARVYAGALHDAGGVKPPPDSWAASPEADLAIFTIKMQPEATLVLPGAKDGSNRALYFFEGQTLAVNGETCQVNQRIDLEATAEVTLVPGEEEVELLYLQGRPIGEPVVQYGPFVMNTSQEIQQAMFDYQNTGFGGWPFERDDPVHSPETGRFARHADGREEKPTTPSLLK